MMDDDAVLIEAPADAALASVVLLCSEMDRHRFGMTEPEWARLSIRLANEPLSTYQRAIIDAYLPGVPIMVGVHPPQHGRKWELDIVHQHGPNTVILGPAPETER